MCRCVLEAAQTASVHGVQLYREAQLVVIRTMYCTGVLLQGTTTTNVGGREECANYMQLITFSLCGQKQRN